MDSSDEEELLFLMAGIIYTQQRRKKPRFWMRNFLKKRVTHGACSSLYNDLVIQDAKGYKNFLRMSPEDLEILLGKISPAISKKNTNFRQAITPKEQLLVTLRYLATGDSYSSLMYLSRISKTKISVIIPEVCKAIVRELAEYVKMPTTVAGWEEIVQNFKSKWNFPHCIGSLDGKHIEIVKPSNSGSDFFNYKKCFSIVLLGLVDAKYNFIYVDVGMKGSISGGDVFKSTSLYRLLSNNTLNLPPAKPLPGRTQASPYVIVGDDAFAISKHLIKPYSSTQITACPETVFNYRLCRVRGVGENAFGIIRSKFRVLRQPIQLSPDKASTITLACVYLHNFLRRSESSRYIYTPAGSLDEINLDNGEIIPGSWRENNKGLISLQRLPRRDCAEGVTVREEFKKYFMTDIGTTESFQM